MGLQKESSEILHKMASKSGQAKYLAPAVFISNFIGIVILMSLYDNLSRDQAIIAWYFLLQNIFFAGMTTSISIHKKCDVDSIVVFAFTLGLWA